MSTGDHTIELWQNGVMVATVTGRDLECVRNEAQHYMWQYEQDGPVEVRQKTTAAKRVPGD